MIRHCETKKFWWKFVIPVPYPYHFRHQKLPETQMASSTKNFGNVRQQILYGKSWFSPPRHKIRRYTKFSETQSFLRETIRSCETKQVWRRIVIPAPALIGNNFWDQKFFETQKSSPTKFLLLWDNKFSIENRDFPLLRKKFFDIRNFLKERKVPLRNDLVLWDKTISTESRHTSPISYS